MTENFAKGLEALVWVLIFKVYFQTLFHFRWVLAGMEHINNDYAFFGYLIDYLVTPFRDRTEVFRFISQIFFNGKLCGEVVQAVGKFYQFLFYFSGCRYRVFGNVDINIIQVIFCQPVPTDGKFLFPYQFSTSFSTSSCEI